MHHPRMVGGVGWSHLELPSYKCRWRGVTRVCQLGAPSEPLKSNSCDAVCNPGHNFWGLFCPPDQPGRAGGGAAARRPRLLRPLHHGLHHVLLLPNLHRPLKGVQLCRGNKLLRSAPSNLWESFSKASSLHFAGRQN